MLKAYPTTDSVLSMKKSPATLQDNYKYDALDRLTTRNATHRFYQNDRIATEVEGANTRRFMEFDAQPLAVQEGQTTSLLATDLQTSVLQHASAAGTQAYAYTPYGHHPAENGITRLLAFNGEHPEAVTGHYLLGQGYRAYNPVLMRFNSPDSWSPFGEGEINAYAYPTNPLMMQDPTGHVWQWIRRLFGRGNVSNEKVSQLYVSAVTGVKNINPSLAEPNLNPTPSTLPETTLISNAKTYIKQGNIVAKKASKKLAKVGTQTSDRNFMSPPNLKKARGTEQNPIDRMYTNNQRNIDTSLRSIGNREKNNALNLFLKAKDNLELVISNRARLANEADAIRKANN